MNTNYLLYLLISACFVQVGAIIFGYNLYYTSIFVYSAFIFSIFLLFRDFYFGGRVNKGYMLYFVFILLLFFSVYCQFVFLDERFDINNKSGINHVRSYAQGIFLWLTIGLALSQARFSYSVKLAYIFILLLLVLLSMGLKEGFVLQYSSLASGRNYDFFLDHLILGSYITLIILFCICLVGKLNILLIILASIVFFIVGGRGDLVILFLTLILYGCIYNQLNHLVLFIVALVLGGGFFYNIQDEGVKRILSVVDLQNDSSFKARADIFISSLDGLDRQFLFGNPNVIIERNHQKPDLSYNLGAISHNIISVWEFYGFFIFLFVLLMIAKILCFILKNKKKLTEPIEKFGVLIFIFTVLSIFLTKSVTYYPFWLCLGFWFTRMYRSSDKE